MYDTHPWLQISSPTLKSAEEPKVQPDQAVKRIEIFSERSVFLVRWCEVGCTGMS